MPQSIVWRNPAKKVDTNGNMWTYLYFGNGMLRKVIKPDKSGVSFKYDPLGRRIEKAVTKAGSEEVSELEGRMPSIEEGTWETIRGVRIRKPNKEMKKPHVVKGINQSIYKEESCKTKEEQEKAESIEKVIRFLWDGNTLLHEWEEENPSNRMKPKSKVDYKADYLLKLEKQEEEKAGEEAERGQRPPDSLVTWIFQDDFIPRGKITKDGNYSIISDYLGTPVEAYDEEGKKVWERELDIYGRVKTGRKDAYGRTEKETGEKNFIPFRFQGQYTQPDPIGIAGGMNLYSYVRDSNSQIDILGWEDIVYRCLRPEDIESINKGLGIVPKNPSANASAIEHVLHGSDDGYADQFISFTRDEKFAERWAVRNNTGVTSVDLDAIHNTKIDLSTAEGRIAHLGDASRETAGSPIHKANKMAKGAREVLVEGEIPNEKIGKGGGSDKIWCPS